MKPQIKISANQFKGFFDELEEKNVELLNGMQFENEGEKKAYIDGLKMAQGNMNEFMNFVIGRASFNYDSEIED